VLLPDPNLEIAMLGNIKRLLAKGKSAASSLHSARLAALVAELGEPDQVDLDSDRGNAIDIYAFGRNFVEDCDEESGDDEGYVLITSGMSDHLMELPTAVEDEPLAVELVWYVRDQNPEYFKNLRWLAKLPRLDGTWLGMGHTVPMPDPPLSFCDFRSFLFLQPIIRTDREIFQGLKSHGESIGTLVVHLISQNEYEVVKTADGLDRFLDLLDENDYPLIFDPKRESIL
jgi:hypothetical protein